MPKTTDQLVRIIAAGGGMRIDANSKTIDQLVRMAAAGAKRQSQLVIINAQSKTTDQLVRIAAAGDGCVFFDFTE